MAVEMTQGSSISCGVPETYPWNQHPPRSSFRSRTDPPSRGRTLPFQLFRPLYPPSSPRPATQLPRSTPRSSSFSPVQPSIQTIGSPSNPPSSLPRGTVSRPRSRSPSSYPTVPAAGLQLQFCYWRRHPNNGITTNKNKFSLFPTPCRNRCSPTALSSPGAGTGGGRDDQRPPSASAPPRPPSASAPARTISIPSPPKMQRPPSRPGR